ncbi:MAG: chemotaxis protein, partial [Anaerolineae bacterium]|nr:chemotaxis protein [Anaerolineae bacterium]
MAAAINQMSATVHEVASNAGQAAEASQQADQEANKGKTLISHTNDSISTLSGEVQQAAQALQELE